MFVKVKNGAVEEVMLTVPNSTENISGFNLLNTIEQVAHGYYPLVEVRDTYDPRLEKLSTTPIYTIEPYRVVATYSKILLSANELLAELTAAKDTQISLIESQYSVQSESAIVYMGTVFQADKESQVLIAHVLIASGGVLPPGFVWYDGSNQPVVMSYTQLQGLAAAILQRGQPLFIQKQDKKAQIRNATDITTITGIV